jgi:hypothetical protein
MIKIIARVLALPFLYLWSFAKALIQYFIFMPLMFILYTIKHLLITIIIAAIVTFFLTPYVGLIVLVLGFIINVKRILGDTIMFASKHFRVDWSHGERFSNDMDFYLSDKRRRKLEKRAIKEYNKNIDEFIGFEIVSDVYRKT